MRRERVVVIGGGFGGLNVVRALDGADVDVTLLDRTNHQLFQPLLYQVATGILPPGLIAPALRSRPAPAETRGSLSDPPRRDRRRPRQLRVGGAQRDTYGRARPDRLRDRGRPGACLVSRGPVRGDDQLIWGLPPGHREPAGSPSQARR
jgi:hypothetical protein